MWSNGASSFSVIDWPMGTQTRALFSMFLRNLEYCWRMKILADVAWRQRLERHCVKKTKLCPNITSVTLPVSRDSSRHDQIGGGAHPQMEFVSELGFLR